MNFHSPHLLWLLVPLLLLFSWELARRVGATASTLPKVLRAWAGAFSVSLASSRTTAESRPRVWLWFGLALCVIALARPQWGVIEERVFDQSREVLIAVDLSRSMLAEDVKPSRLERAKLLITSLLDRLQGERVGLVLFAGTSFLQSPLSADYEILREFLPSLKPDYLPEGGSNYKAMLETSMQAFGTSAADRYLIVLSDGESTEEGWRELNESLKNKAIRVIGLGIGTTQGAFIPDGSGGFVKDERGAVVLSRLNNSTLHELAQTTGGAYTDASTWVDLPALLRRTVEAGQKGDFSEKSTARLIERYQWFLAPGLLLLLISFWAEFPVRPRERALPLAGAAKIKSAAGKQSAALVALLSLALLGTPRAASAQEADESALAKPLTTTVAQLVAKKEITAKEFADFVQKTITFGQRQKTAQQKAPEKVITDGLAAVDAGERLDAKAADWPRLRKELEELLEKPEPPPEDEKQKQDEQQKQDQQVQQQQQQNQQNQDQQQSKDQQQQQQSDQQKQQDEQSQQQQQQQDAFGDMQEKQEQPPPSEESEEQSPPQQPPMQKVGGQKEKKDQSTDPDLAMPLQKLEQVRDQDAPAKLHLLMQGKQQKPTKKGKDW